MAQGLERRANSESKGSHRVQWYNEIPRSPLINPTIIALIGQLPSIVRVFQARRRNADASAAIDVSCGGPQRFVQGSAGLVVAAWLTFPLPLLPDLRGAGSSSSE